jgi:hypothetical protein
VLKNSSMLLWSPDQGLKDPPFAVCWPWFGSVEFIFDLPTGQIAPFQQAGAFCELRLYGNLGSCTRLCSPSYYPRCDMGKTDEPRP